MKDKGSEIYGIRNPGKSFSWYMRFKCPPNIFADKKFMPGWAINFFLDLKFWINIDDINKNIKIHEFFKSNLENLKSEFNDYSFIC